MAGDGHQPYTFLTVGVVDGFGMEQTLGKHPLAPYLGMGTTGPLHAYVKVSPITVARSVWGRSLKTRAAVLLTPKMKDHMHP